MAGFGEKLRQLREGRGITQEELGRVLNVRKAAISKYEAGHLSISLDSIQILAKFFDVPVAYFVENDFIPRSIPILGQIRAGAPLLTPDNYAGNLDIPSDIEADFALQVVGESMVGAGILEGDYAVCCQAQAAQSGQIVAVLHDIAVDFSEITLKYYFAENGTKTVLRSANPDFGDIIMNGQYRIAGVMVALIRKAPPSYKVFADYISVKDYTLSDWNQVIERAVQCGMGTKEMKELIEMQWKMAQRITGINPVGI